MNLYSTIYIFKKSNIYKLEIDMERRKFVIWITGLSWSWKTTIAIWLSKKLQEKWHTDIIKVDGDEVRNLFNKDLWFGKEDRFENIARVINYIDWLISNKNGIIASFISPYEEMRNMVKEKFEHTIEVFIDCPIEVCEQRDVKWLYQKARRWEILGFTGIHADAPYEKPQNPHIRIHSHLQSPQESVEVIYYYLKNNWFI